MRNGELLVTNPNYDCGTSVKFQCNSGFVHQGDNSLTCLPSGEWDVKSAMCSKAGQYCVFFVLFLCSLVLIGSINIQIQSSSQL